MPRATLACLALFLSAAAPVSPGRAPVGTPVALAAHPGTRLDAAARQLAADDLAAARARHDRPLLLTGAADLGGERPALFVQLQSAQECGSAGCTTDVYDWAHGKWRRILDGVTGRIVVSPKRTKGRPDLLTEHERFVWTGSAYRSTAPAPALDLRPHPHRGRVHH